MTRSSVAYGAGGRGAIVAAIAALAWVGTGCSSRAGGSGTDPADAAVTFQSAAVTTPAIWNSLYGSWPAGRFDHAMAYDTDVKGIVMFGGCAAARGRPVGDRGECDSGKG